MNNTEIPADARTMLAALHRAGAHLMKVRPRNLHVDLKARAREQALQWLRSHGLADWIYDATLGRLWYLTKEGLMFACRLDKPPATPATGSQ